VEAASHPAARLAASARSLGLTPRQEQVLGLLAQGLSNRAIAVELGCAEATVEVHVTALLRKSGCESRCEVMARVWSDPGAGTEWAGPSLPSWSRGVNEAADDGTRRRPRSFDQPRVD
jgi:DNA-binding CsgD family transcriptional regulator